MTVTFTKKTEICVLQFFIDFNEAKTIDIIKEEIIKTYF